MNSSPASFSDEALSKLVCESHATVKTSKPSTRGIRDRVRTFGQLYGDLASKPEGVALLFRESAAVPVRCQPIGRHLVVGRLPKGENNAAGCDLAFEDDRMSRTHFEITLADGLYLLRDLESRNGTYVNGDPTRIREIALKDGDLIFAGGIVFAQIVEGELTVVAHDVVGYERNPWHDPRAAKGEIGGMRDVHVHLHDGAKPGFSSAPGRLGLEAA